MTDNIQNQIDEILECADVASVEIHRSRSFTAPNFVNVHFWHNGERRKKQFYGFAWQDAIKEAHDELCVRRMI